MSEQLRIAYQRYFDLQNSYLWYRACIPKIFGNNTLTGSRVYAIDIPRKKKENKKTSSFVGGRSNPRLSPHGLATPTLWGHRHGESWIDLPNEYQKKHIAEHESSKSTTDDIPAVVSIKNLSNACTHSHTADLVDLAATGELCRGVTDGAKFPT
ncbi:MAG: hypothetical protein COA78_11400 [Blastopirellula sp.]|nr:MAG: hypothetical protein COA78_11400 [Blastopirellula sp.]